MTRRERRNIRNAVLITAVIALLLSIIAASIASRMAVSDTLNRVAGSCVDPQLSGFVIRGQIFYCHPQMRPDLK